MKHRFLTYPMASLACIGCLFTTSLTIAQNKQKQANKSADPSKKAQAENYYKTEKLPQALRNLDLTSEQKTNIRKAMLDHQKKFRQTWKKFHAAHARAINLESAWYAAVRDTLSEEDQKTFDQKRMKEEKAAKENYASAERKQARQDRKQRAAERQKKSASNEKAKPKDDSKKVTARKPVQSRKQDQQGTMEKDADGFIVITVTSPVRYLRGLQQTVSQQHQCDEVCRKYQQELAKTWKQLHRLHTELVKIEAQKLDAIEDQLTDEQLTRLRENRQKPSKPQEAASASESKKN